MTKVRVLRNIKYKGGHIIPKGAVLEAEGPRISPELDWKHKRATGEYRWVDGYTYTVEVVHNEYGGSFGYSVSGRHVEVIA